MEDARLHRRTNDRRDGAVLLTVTSVLILAVLFTGAFMTISISSSRAEYEVDEIARCDYVVYAATEQALSEILSGVDDTGNGIGAIGIVTPASVAVSSGQSAAEYRTVVTQVGGNAVIQAIAAIPSFTAPTAVRSMQVIVSVEPTFTFSPLPGTISVRGPVNALQLPSIGSNHLRIYGGSRPAIQLSRGDAFDTLMQALGAAIFADNGFYGSELEGPDGTAYGHPDAGMTLSVDHYESSFMTPQVLEQYRVDLRAAVLALAADVASVQISATVIGNQTWGTHAVPQVTVIDAEAIGAASIFSTDNQTITGNGTLIINGSLDTTRNLNLEWTGDVFVLADNGTDTLRLHGAHGTVDGNFVVLADGNTGAHLDLGDSTAAEVAVPRGSSLAIDGSLLFFAEAALHKAEIRVDGSSSVAIDGMLGLFGSEIRIGTESSTSSLAVDGALALGIGEPDDGSVAPGQGVEIELRGSVDLLRNESKLEAAISGLVGLESTFSVGSGSSVKRTYRVSRSGAVNGSAGGVDVQEAIESLISGYGPDHDYGFVF